MGIEYAVFMIIAAIFGLLNMFDSSSTPEPEPWRWEPRGHEYDHEFNAHVLSHHLHLVAKKEVAELKVLIRSARRDRLNNLRDGNLEAVRSIDRYIRDARNMISWKREYI